MHVINAKNVNNALPIGLLNLAVHGVDRDSRNGPVRVFPTPVTTVYHNPTERVMFYPERDCNPFFHFFESLWMLAGRNDVAYLTKFVKRMQNFSDDGKTFHGAYGHRWRSWFGFDQITVIAEALKKNPDDRRCVMQMWDAETDLGKEGKDFPCNTQVIFSRSASGALDMTVCNRSNDMVWGAYGANAVHFSFLQEYIAAAIGCRVGIYYQVSNNLHAYLDTLEQVHDVGTAVNAVRDVYDERNIEPFPLCSTSIEQWDQDLGVFMDVGPVVGFQDPFFRRVVTPMWNAFQAYKSGDGVNKYDAALEILQQCKAQDWKQASEEWLLRRKEAFLNKKVA